MITVQKAMTAPNSVLLIFGGGKPRRSRSRIHAKRVDSSVFVNLRLFAIESSRAGIPLTRLFNVVGGTSYAEAVLEIDLKRPFL